MRFRAWVCVVAGSGILLLAGCAANRAAMTGNAEMPYPPSSPPKVEEIRHLPTGLRLSIDGMIEMLSGARLVSVGETHDNLNDQRVELTVVRELHRRFPGKVAVGMEMFREPQQAVLDRWVKGELTELEFLKASKWYETWGFDFGAYRDLLLFAKEHRIDLIALNPPKELQEAVRRTGLDNVPEDLRRNAPGGRRDRSVAARRPARRCSRGTRGTAAGTNRSPPSSASSCSGRRRWRRRWSIT